MPRQARIKSESGYYHVLLRGINKQKIFIDDQDNSYFLKVVERYKNELGFKLAAYCLMGNHVHLLIGDRNDSLDVIMKKIAGSYAYYFNHKYDRTGHLFQDRFRSEPINDDSYFLTVIRYIHQNPLKAHIAEVDSYSWSSYACYVSRRGMIDADMTYDLLGGVAQFVEFVNHIDKADCLEVNSASRITDIVAEQIVAAVLESMNLNSFSNAKIQQIAEAVIYLREKGLSERQISRLTKISRNRLASI